MILLSNKKVNPVKFHGVDTAKPYFTGSIATVDKKGRLALPLFLILFSMCFLLPQNAEAASYVTNSYVHTTGTSGALNSPVQVGDVIVIIARDGAGRHATASDTGINAGAYAEQGWVADANSGAVTLTVLTKVVTTAGTPAITVASASYFDAWAMRGLSSATKNTSGTGAGDFAASPVLIAATSPSVTSTLVIGWGDSVSSGQDWTSWNKGGGAGIVNLGHNTAEHNASGYVLNQRVSPGAYTPGANVTGGSSRAVVIGVYLPNAFTPTKVAVSPINALTKGLVGYWTFDGKNVPWTSATAATAIDSSGSGNTGTLTSMNRATSPTPGKIGQALKFNGVSNYVGTSNVKNIGVGFSGTVSFWAKGSGVSISNERTIEVTQGDGGITVNSNGSLTYSVDSAGSSPYVYELTNTTTANTSNWNFYVLNLSVPSSSGTLSGTLYVNGIQQVLTNTSYVVSGSISSYANIDIGRWRNYTYSTSYFTGSIDDVRIYNRALSAGEVSQLYKQGAAKLAVSPINALTNGLVGYWTFDGKNTNWTTGKTNDLSGQGNTGQLISMSTTTSPTAGKIGQALKFDGTSSYITMGNPGALSFNGGSNITECAWVKLNVAPSSSGSGAIVGRWQSAGGDNNRSYTMGIGGSGTTFPGLAFFIQDSVGNPVFSNSGANPSTYLNTWKHFCGTFNGATIITYVNGVQVDTTASAVVIDTSSQNFNIGAHSDVSTFLNAQIDDVRVYSRALSATEVLKLYKLGSSKTR